VTTYRRLDAELSPYARAAADLTGRLGAPAPWTTPSMLLSRLLAALTGRHIALQGLPVAAIDQTLRTARRIARPGLITYRADYRLTADPLETDQQT
jgi:hypothetical protein